MTELEMNQAVEQQAKSALGAQVTNLKVRPRVKSFLDGSLFFVYYQRPQDANELLLYAYLRGDGQVVIINNIDELSNIISVYQPKSSFLADAFSLGAIAGLIAILITVTLCYLIAFKGVNDPPQILSAALTAILGFYFGSKVTGKKVEQ